MGKTITCNYVLSLEDGRRMWEMPFHQWKELRSSVNSLLRASGRAEGIFYIFGQTKTAKSKIRRELEKAGLLCEKLFLDGHTFSFERSYIKLQANLEGNIQFIP